MKTVNFNKKMQDIYRRYVCSCNYSLSDIYDSYSTEKVRAFDYCNELMEQHNGKALKIIGGNKTQFSAGFIYTNESKEEIFVYITKDYDRQCKVDKGVLYD